MNNEKIYIGKGKKNQYGLSVNLCLSAIPKELIFESKRNGKRYLTIFVNPLREIDQDGNDHTVFCLPKQAAKPQVTADNVEQYVF